MAEARKVRYQPCCDGEDCPFVGEYHVYDRHNKQVGAEWCEGCATAKVASLNAYEDLLARRLSREDSGNG